MGTADVASAKETLAGVGAFAWKLALISGLIFLAAVATPYIAKKIDKKKLPTGDMPKKDKENPDDGKSEDDDKNSEPKVQSLFEGSRIDGFDPNYKIYNTDIYGFNNKDREDIQKNGKEQ